MKIIFPFRVASVLRSRSTSFPVANHFWSVIFCIAFSPGWSYGQDRFIELPDGKQIRLSNGTYAISKSDGQFTSPRKTEYKVKLRAEISAPETNGVIDVPQKFAQALDSEDADATGLFLVQFYTAPLPAYRKALTEAGFEILDYIPSFTFLVRGNTAAAEQIKNLDYVRWSDAYHPAFKLPLGLRQQLDEDALTDAPLKYTFYTTSSEDVAQLATVIEDSGGSVHSQSKSRIVVASMTPDQLMGVLKANMVQWVEKWQAPEEDMNNARKQGGADYLESKACVPEGFTGIGIRGHVMEGINPAHPDFASNSHRTPPVAVDDGASSSHGHATFGIVFGSGAGDSIARGMLPNGQGFYTHYRAITAPPGGGGMGIGTRYELVQRLIDDHQILFQTASWGNGRTERYSAVSAEMDHLIFDLDLPITQSQSNAGTTQSRPQAWAKNIISVGAVHHNNNATAADDSWQNGNASIGPASDGRIKPDICAYYDATHTTDLTGYRDFGGTSGATPIVAGHVGLILEMWSKGCFGNPQKVPGGSYFENRPHFTTIKALLIASARQYNFNSTSSDNRREHQGWGFPDLKQLYDSRGRMYIIDESQRLEPLEEHTDIIMIEPGESLLKVCMTYADPPGSPSSAELQVNDLDLKVTAPDGTTYFGNVGLREGVSSVAGGAPDTIDTVECVIVDGPDAGQWEVTVSAPEIVADGHLETPEIDADYALVVIGGVAITP